MRVRSREFSSPGLVTRLNFIKSGATFRDNYDQDFALASNFYYKEYIADQVGVKSRKVWKDVSHYVAGFDPHSPLPYASLGHRYYAPDHDDITNAHHLARITDPFWLLTYGDGTFNFNPVFGLDEWYLLSDDQGEQSLSLPNPDNLADLTERGLNTMLPRIRQELSLLNSLWEVGDLGRLVGQCAQIVTQLEKLAAHGVRSFLNVARYKDILHPEFFRTFAKEAANQHLGVSFGLLPMVSDIVAVKTALDSYMKQVLRNLSRTYQRRVAHFAQPLDTPPSSSIENNYQVFIDPVITYHKVTREVFNASAMFRSEIEYSYEYSNFQLVHAPLLALLDSLGVNFNLGTVWRAIPFSFVIDWFVNVGKLLDRLTKIRNFEPTISIHQYCWSFKRSRTIVSRREISTNYPPNGSGPSVQVFPAYKETSYKRSTIMPSTLTTAVSNLDGVKIGLGSSLAIQRLLRRRNKRFRVR